VRRRDRIGHSPYFEVLLSYFSRGAGFQLFSGKRLVLKNQAARGGERSSTESARSPTMKDRQLGDERRLSRELEKMVFIGHEGGELWVSGAAKGMESREEKRRRRNRERGTAQHAPKDEREKLVGSRKDLALPSWDSRGTMVGEGGRFIEVERTFKTSREEVLVETNTSEKKGKTSDGDLRNSALFLHSRGRRRCGDRGEQN